MYAPDAPLGRIGPNAVTRLAEALTAYGGSGLAASVFARAGLARYLDAPPADMVDEAEVARLHAALAVRLHQIDSIAVARDAGRRTADYLLARRIPRPAQWLLARLPPRLAAAILVRAIARHAWTFTGSGRFGFAADQSDRRVMWLSITGAPIDGVGATPACAYFAATFEGVFGAMLGPRVRVVETQCGAACRFRLSW